MKSQRFPHSAKTKVLLVVLCDYLPIDWLFQIDKMELSAVALMFFFGVLKYYQRSELTTVYIPSLGQLRGSEMTTFNGRSFQAFRGIPYAKPPTGHLRFQVDSQSCYFFDLQVE